MANSDTEQGHAEDHVAHVVQPMWLYLGVFGALIFMTVVTVGASYVDFGAANTVIAVIIASVKATLVATFFMNLLHDRRFNALIFVSGLVFLSFLFIFTMSDTGTRGMVDDINGTKVPSPLDSARAAPAGSGAHGAAPAHH